MKRFGMILVSAFLSVPSCALYADVSGEKASLQRLAWEVHAMEQLLQEAESMADPAARYPFRYDYLRQDLLTIRHGIEAYISTPQDRPVNLNKLKGNYRR
ncbi:MAG: RAQPRD family integrative conjugative element protein [Candidatus Thiodiazotropha taylori]|nr:RAQPRD family integrative conjugative element protein [Candidatus Thiodiazotropha taylori]MCG7961155.1 RAQPRD family integrative conjugative element protein [Candidatus Thiodiazotropha endolucinida]MCW4227193.1 RAQPRD family integrative conjugative element protein [Candidatus Thiodiazotropha taylori]